MVTEINEPQSIFISRSLLFWMLDADADMSILTICLLFIAYLWYFCEAKQCKLIWLELTPRKDSLPQGRVHIPYEPENLSLEPIQMETIACFRWRLWSLEGMVDKLLLSIEECPETPKRLIFPPNCLTQHVAPWDLSFYSIGFCEILFFSVVKLFPIFPIWHFRRLPAKCNVWTEDFFFFF